mmetsp:Transcript_4553/g.11550  ORF Transcript_4553/g.11550 Transcript_4553/m.11550 type:complete len:97 (+) Transcript_4553:60-350(+)
MAGVNTKYCLGTGPQNAGNMFKFDTCIVVVLLLLLLFEVLKTFKRRIQAATDVPASEVLISSEVVGTENIPKLCSKAASCAAKELAAQQSFSVYTW